jgi:putative membrane protein
MEEQKKIEQIDVDVRFLLANERTLLAWIRTSLAIQAGGVALALTRKHSAYAGIIILLFGAGSALIGYHRFVVADRSIRRHHLPPSGNGPTVQVAGIVLAAVCLAIAQLTFLR